MKIDGLGRNLESHRVFMVKEGLITGWVCAPKILTKEEVQDAVDATIPGPGTIANRWIVDDGHFCFDNSCTDERHVSPGHCSEDKDRQHWRVVC